MEASFAALYGVSPVEHPSGKSRHRRLNHGVSRQGNAALYRIVPTRLRREERTPAPPRTTHCGRQDQTRGHPVSQALRGMGDPPLHPRRTTAPAEDRNRLTQRRGINLNVHLTAGIRQFIAGRDRLTVYQLPSHAPDLDPVECIWWLLRRGHNDDDNPSSRSVSRRGRTATGRRRLLRAADVIGVESVPQIAGLTAEQLVGSTEYEAGAGADAGTAVGPATRPATDSIVTTPSRTGRVVTFAHESSRPSATASSTS
ncbi:transposase [Streptomyces sp. NBC_00996]|uniref:transposase n=1 Tax=Streptomyces sp. NBC_00996 TaxID=2903710 RepID=UPI003868E315